MNKFVCINGAFGYQPDNIVSSDTFKEAQEGLNDLLNRLVDESEEDDCTIKKYTQENEFPDGKDYLLVMIYCNSRHGHGAEYIEVRQSEED